MSEIVVKAANKNYKHYTNVCGVSYGAKFTGGVIDNLQDAVQFFVTSKVSLAELKKSLPRFVYGRAADGSVDFSTRIATDVIELKDLELCCQAGDEVAVSGVNGTVTLLFENRASPGEQLALTCSHVVGGLDQSPPSSGRMVGGNDDCLFIANLIGNTTTIDDHIEYDIAVGQVTDDSDAFVEYEVAGESQRLDGFASPDIFELDQTLSLSSEISNVQIIVVNSRRTELEDIDAGGGRNVSVGNLFVCTGSVARGDSGGIVYHGSKAAGIVVGRTSNGWVLVQNLQEAVTALSAKIGKQITCF